MWLIESEIDFTFCFKFFVTTELIAAVLRLM